MNKSKHQSKIEGKFQFSNKVSAPIMDIFWMWAYVKIW